MKYTAKYFKDNLPEWKRRKDPLVGRLLFRPLSFYATAVCANLGITANTVSYFSAFVAVIASLLFLVDSFLANLLAAILVNVWVFLDCIDGNLARNVRKQPFGPFADSLSSYILVGLMCTTMSVVVYRHGGYFMLKENFWIIVIGALASSADTLMRLIYQKYKATLRELNDEGISIIEEDTRTDNRKVDSLAVRIETEFGIDGILPILILICTVANTLDLVIGYCFFYYGGACLAMSLKYIRKAIKHTKDWENSYK